MDKDVVDKAIEPADADAALALCGCINRNFCSSCLFLIPVIYGYLINYPAVAIGSFICFLTSVAHHYYQAKHKVFQLIDKICVNSIAAYFTYQCFTKIGFTFYANLMYIFGLAALLLYFYHVKRPHLYKSHYCCVHLLAITGIMCYIKAYHEKKKEDRDKENENALLK